MNDHTLPQLRAMLAERDHDLQRVKARLQDAEQRAALAEKSARDAWAFAKTVFQRA